MKIFCSEPVAVVLTPSMSVELWDIAREVVLATITNANFHRIDFCAIFPSNNSCGRSTCTDTAPRIFIAFTLFAEGAGPSTIQIWDLISTEKVFARFLLEMNSFVAEKDTVSSVATSDNVLITGHADSKLKIWHLTSYLESLLEETKINADTDNRSISGLETHGNNISAVRVVDTAKRKFGVPFTILKGHTGPSSYMYIHQNFVHQTINTCTYFITRKFCKSLCIL